jgi:hypothetical protein
VPEPLNVWGASCQVCDRKILVFEDWYPYQDGIVHVGCDDGRGDEEPDEDEEHDDA